MKKYAILFILISYNGCKANSENKWIYGSEDVDKKISSDTMTVFTDEPIHKVQPFFWGTNLLFWIEDDASLADKVIVKRLKEINIKMLRFPGGTVADNYHWKTNTLHNKHRFPFQDGEAKTDFDEFIRICRETGAEPSVVVNTESWAVDNDIAKGAHEAAEWLRYCKMNNYDVKFWEIGNETYWHPIISAREYAHIVNVYADSLKKVDPTIQIGVNGHWDTQMVGAKDRFKKDALEEMVALYKDVESREDNDTYKTFFHDNKIYPITKGDIKWWETVAENCGHNVDMIVVHWYFGPSQLDIMSKKLLEVRQLFAQKYPEKSFLLNISEYNTTQLSNFKNDEHLYLTEAIGAMLNAKTDIASFWPMRMKNYGKLRLLDFETSKLSIIAKIHQQLSKSLKGSLVRCDVAENIPAFATYSENGGSVVLTGRLIDKPTTVTVQLNASQQKFSFCQVWRITGKKFNYEIKEEKLNIGKDGCTATIEIDPLEVVVAEFR